MGFHGDIGPNRRRSEVFGNSVFYLANPHIGPSLPYTLFGVSVTRKYYEIDSRRKESCRADA